ncbi:MAG: hypothetical protein ACTJGH_02830 [Peptoniphilaceae bacterium]
MNGILNSLLKNLKLIYKGKFLFLILGSFIIYSLYIQFGYSKTDVSPFNVYVLENDLSNDSKSISSVQYSPTLEKLEEQLYEDKNGIGLIERGSDKQIIYHKSSSDENDNIRVDYALAIKDSKEPDTSVRVIGSNSRKEKLVKEMTWEVLFFEIVAVGFLGIAALFFQEKQSGVINVIGILPSQIWKELILKLGMFLFFDILFAIILVFINIGFIGGLLYYLRIILHVIILSIIMTNLGLLFSLYFKDFKQFGVIYTFLTIFLTAPIFIVANTAVSLDIMKYNYFYILYRKTKDIFFGGKLEIDAFYLISIALIVLLYTLTLNKYKKILQGR